MALSGKMTTFVLQNEKIQSPYQRAKIHNFCVSEKKMSLSGICLALKKVDTTVNKNEDRKEKEVQAGFHA